MRDEGSRSLEYDEGVITYSEGRFRTDFHTLSKYFRDYAVDGGVFSKQFAYDIPRVFEHEGSCGLQ